MSAPRLVAIFVTMSALAAAPQVLAQRSATLALVGGRSTDSRGVHSDAVTVAPGISLPLGPRHRVALGAHATRFTQSDAWSAGVRGALSTQRPLGAGFTLSTHTDAAASTTSFDVSYLTADFAPALEWRWRDITLHGGARGALGTTTASATGTLPPLPPGNASAGETRRSLAPHFGARVRLLNGRARTGAVIWAREDQYRIDDARLADRTVGATLVVHALTVSASAGRRLARDEQRTFGGAAVSVALARGVSLDVAGGSYPADRLAGAAHGTYASAGFTFRAGGVRALPVAAGVPPAAHGLTRISIRARDARVVEILGDWNGWTPERAQRAPNGVWYVDVRLAPGDYRYAFRVNEREWRVPDGTAAVDDGFGGKSAYVSVRGTTPEY